MSTVDKSIADRVIAGEFPEDKIIAIVQYDNQFNGAKAYKLIFAHQEHMLTDIHSISPAMRNCKLYWKKGN